MDSRNSSKGGRALRAAVVRDVRVRGGFLGPRVANLGTKTLPTQYEQCRSSGRFDAFRLDWKSGMPNKPHIFRDSDVAKWIEAVGYHLAVSGDAELERRADEVIELIASAQLPDGYLNSYFIAVEPQARWTSLRHRHELYCAGHLIEGAVAYYEGTGKRRLLEVVCRYADHIDSVFGPEEGKLRGYGGHEEIELALVKLYRCTAERRYLELARFFVEERGRQPHYYHEEARRQGETAEPSYPSEPAVGLFSYAQAHVPVREQTSAEGHAVRAMYLYCGMADVAAESGDAELLAVCRSIWENAVGRRMYLTGGVGSTREAERFTYDYHLPNETAYAETCAAIGLFLFSSRMVSIERDGRYADVMERTLYNGILSGVSLDGERYFYANPLEVYPPSHTYGTIMMHRNITTERQPWFQTSCCPPNLSRTLASIGSHAYATDGTDVWVHLYLAGEAVVRPDGGPVRLAVSTDYPMDGAVRITLGLDAARRFGLRLHVPGWCRGYTLRVNGSDVRPQAVERGYLLLEREWADGEVVEVAFEMPVEVVEAHPAVRADAGKVALTRGPLVYCFEETDNGPGLAAISVDPTGTWRTERIPGLLERAAVLRGRGWRRTPEGWGGELYRPVPSERGGAVTAVELTAVPYCLWCNRTLGEMTVWVGRYDATGGA